jgi:hypothetical protein
MPMIIKLFARGAPTSRMLPVLFLIFFLACDVPVHGSLSRASPSYMRRVSHIACATGNNCCVRIQYCNHSRCCLLLQYLIQSCARGGRRIVEDMCYEIVEIRRAEACVD